MVQAKQRFNSVDFFRGLTVAFMIVANNPGDTASVYSEFVHSRWHGWTAVDFIFPIFLFIVGISIALAASPDKIRSAKGRLWPKAFKRAGLLFLLGLMVNGFPYYDLESIRIPGVLQRIAVVYLAALWFHLHFGRKGLIIAIAAILVGYWILWAYVPVPGLGFPTLDYEYNLESWLDQLFMRGHLWEYDTSWDPEGLLSTLPCVALALMGVLGGRWLRSASATSPWLVCLLGLGLHVLGWAWDASFPINKIITTSSFVVFVGGVGIALMAVFHVLIDGKPAAFWVRPFIALGKNALFIYVVSEIFTDILFFVRLPWLKSGKVSLHSYLFDAVSRCIDDRYVASMLWAVGLAFLLTLLAMAMEKRGLVVRL